MTGFSSSHAECGIHVRGATPCRYCARANALNAAALEGVIPKPAIAFNQWRQTIPEATKARVRERHAAGESIASIARAENIAQATAGEIAGTRPKRRSQPNFKSERGKRGGNEAMWARSTKAARDEQRTMPLPRGVRTG